MTIKNKMSLTEINDQLSEVQAKRQMLIVKFRAEEITMQELKTRLGGLRIITDELERQRKKAKK